MDPVHTEWLHSYWTFYQMEREGKEVPKTPDGRYATFRHTRIGFDIFEHGIIKRRLMEGQTEDHDDWKTGHPVIFPYTLRNGNGFQIRVPVDDTHTHHITYRCSFPKEGEEREPIRIHDMPIKDTNGKVFTHQTLYQDMWAWWSQGPLAQRHLERLAESDKGVILFRRLLKEQVDLALDGGDPMNVFRDPAKNQQIDLHTEQTQYMAFIGNTNVEEAVQGRSERAMRSLAGFQNTKEA
jgi:5,5'-dehydrodivanillate O-demethylase